MITGAEIEIVEISSFVEKFSDSLTTYFTKNEIDYCAEKMNGFQNFTVRLAAKKALFKALKISQPLESDWQQVELINDEFGKPQVHVSNNIKNIIERKKITSINVSLSHIESSAVAMIILEI